MLSARNDRAKCTGEGCADRVRCGRFLRPAGEHQAYDDFWKAGDKCQSYESVPAEYHETEDMEEPPRLGF